MRKLAAAALLLLLAGCQTAPHPQAYPPLPPPQAGYPPPPPQAEPGTPPLKAPRPVPNYSGTAGPLAAAGVGRYMDEMERDLRRVLKGTPVARPGDALAINLRDDALFEKGASFGDDGRDLLRALAAVLRHYDHTQVQVNGYEDTRLAPDRSLAQSQKHADAVAGLLRGNGVAGGRIVAVGYGQTHLKIATGAGKAEPRNRRVEIRILPHPG
ncbi:MAG TPA: OmpA family protein [Rhizomicrobium sp.]|nr:OmpA family protein [Rhizomicrobium sp.]